LEAFARQNDVFFQFSITTNGSLLTLDRVLYLAKHRVGHVKITLDGPPDVHDTRRVPLNDRGTFSRILDRLRDAVRHIDVILRVNIDESNLPHVHQLLDILEAECGENCRRLHFDYNLVFDHTAHRVKSDIDYSAIHALESSTLDRGFRLKMPALVRSRYCSFNSRGSFLIDTKGSAFLCSKEERFKVAAVKDLIAAPSDQFAGSQAVAASFRETKDICFDCNLLPICGGGCTLMTQMGGGPPCPGWKEHLGEYLALQYRVLCQNGKG
jgi:uncharacterized protein